MTPPTKVDVLRGLNRNRPIRRINCVKQNAKDRALQAVGSVQLSAAPLRFTITGRQYRDHGAAIVDGLLDGVVPILSRAYVKSIHPHPDTMILEIARYAEWKVGIRLALVAKENV